MSTFPTVMNYAEVTPVHKKENYKENYHLKSILPNLTKFITD